MMVSLAIAGMAAGYVFNNWQHEQKMAALKVSRGNETLVSSIRPLFKLNDLEDKTRDIKEWDGQVVMINFWATWCPPCVAEMPGLQDLYDRYQGKVSFLFVTSDKKQRVFDFMNSKDYSFPVYFEASRSPEPLISKSLPSTYIIDQNGKVVVEKVGAADWNSPKVHRLLESLLQ